MRGITIGLTCWTFLVGAFVSAAPDEEILLAAKGEAPTSVVYAATADDVLRNICVVFSERIKKRIACEFGIASESEAGGAGARCTVFVGRPSGSGPFAPAWKAASLPDAEIAALGPGGFAVAPARIEGRTCFFLVGADRKGCVAAVGKFLRSLDLRDDGVYAPLSKVLDRTDPNQIMELQQYKPAQWGNPFKDAPIEMMKEYVEDLALWGSDSLWNVCCYMINNPFTPGTDAESVKKWARVRDLFAYAHSLGMGIGLVDCPNSVYDDQLYLRDLGGKFTYREDVCPSIPKAHEVLLSNREQLCRAAREAGIEFKYFLHFAHDNGGCDCEKCRPWIMTYIRLNEEFYRLALKYHPHVKIFMTTWMLTPDEKKMMLDYVTRERPAWLAGVMDRPGVKLPPGYLSSGWQTIMTYGPDRTYGKMGADPMPSYLQFKVNEFRKQGIRAIFTYSEGTYDDINSAAIAQICRHPASFSARDFLEEYCHWNYGTDATQSARLAALIDENFTATPFAHSASVGVKSPERVRSEMEETEKTMPVWGRENWRYGILKDKVELECLSERTGSVGWWLPRVKEMLNAARSAPTLEDARGQLRQAAAHLRDVSDEFEACSRKAREVTRHLYLDLYKTPHRHAAHGSFVLNLPWAKTIAALAKQCDKAEKISNIPELRAALDEMIARLPSELESDRTVKVPANLALRRPASASSVYDHRFPPEKAVDGASIVIYLPSENAWASAEKGGPSPEWWQVDLGRVQPVRQVRIWFRNLSGGYGFVPRTVSIELSDDGGAWRTALGSSSAVPKEGEPYDRRPSIYEVTGQGRYLRILFENGSQRPNSRGIELTEVEVY